MIFHVFVFVTLASIELTEARTLDGDELAKNSILEVNFDENVEISFASNPSTGFSWSVTSVDEEAASALTLVGEPSFLASVRNKPGAPGRTTFRFRSCTTNTESTYVFFYKRVWEENVEPAQRKVVNVHCSA